MVKYQVVTVEHGEVVDATDGERFDTFADARECLNLLLDMGLVGQEAFVRHAPTLPRGETREQCDERIAGC